LLDAKGFLLSKIEKVKINEIINTENGLKPQPLQAVP